MRPALKTLLLLSLGFMSFLDESAIAAQPSMDLFNRCIGDAIARNNVSETAGNVQYTCNAKLAESYFNFLASNGFRKSQMTDKNKGLFVYIDMGHGHSGCYHQIENLDGTAASDFLCTIRIQAPQE